MPNRKLYKNVCLKNPLWSTAKYDVQTKLIGLISVTVDVVLATRYGLDGPFI
jgi:hypothetical protein